MKRLFVAVLGSLAVVLLGISLFRVPDRHDLIKPPPEEPLPQNPYVPRRTNRAAEAVADPRPAWARVAEALGVEPAKPARKTAIPAQPMADERGGPAKLPARPDASTPAAPPVPGAAEHIPPGSHAVAAPQGATSSTTTSPSVPESGPDPEDRSTDRRPPTLVAISFDPPAISDGETSNLDATVTDDLAGVESVTGTVSSPSGKAILGFSARRIGDSDIFEAILAIPAKAEQGTWFVSSLYLKDRAANARSVGYTKDSAPPGARLQVESDESDSTPPVVEDIRLDRSSLATGEKNRIWVHATDDRSGVSTISGVFESPGKSARIGFSCVEDPGSGSWTGEIVTPKDADCGEWKLQQLLAIDKANNRRNYGATEPVISRVAFYLTSGAGCDSTAPVLDAITIIPSVVSSDQDSVVMISAMVHDEGSGVSSASGRIEGPPSKEAGGQTPKIYFTLSSDPKEPPNVWSAHATVPRFSAKGMWRVTSLQVIDKSNNFRIYNASDPALAPAILEVK